MNQPSDPVLVWVAGMDNLVQNSGFEEGISNVWRVEAIRGAGFTANYAGAPGLTGVPVLSGSSCACLTGKSPTGAESALYQDVSLPSAATSAVLSWLVWVDDGSSTYAKELRVEVRDLNNQVLAVVSRADQTGLPFRSSWRMSADLSEFVGRTVRVAFVAKLGSQGRLQLDEVRLMTAPMPGVSFEVYLATGSSINETNLLARTSDLRWACAELKAGASYSWQVVTVRGDERTPGPVWRFRTGNRATLDHYVFEPLASPQVVGVPFAFEIAARDALNFSPTDNPSPNTAALDLAALAPSVVRPRVLLSEVLVSTSSLTTNSVECANVSPDAIDISGWQIALYDETAYRSPRSVFVIPAGTSLAPGAVLVLRSKGKAPGTFPNFCTGQSVTWYLSPNMSRVGVALLDSGTNVVDFVSAYRIEPVDVTNPAPVRVEQWLGPAIGAAQSATPSYQRVGQVDTQGTNGWRLTTNSIGLWNAGLESAFLPGAGRLAVLPERITNSAAGVWTGTGVMLGAGTNVQLCARDAKGRYGLSRSIDVKSLPLVTLEVPAVLREGQILSTNAGMARLQQAVGTNVIVLISAPPTGELDLPTSILIPAGATAADFAVQARDNVDLTGPTRAAIAGFSDGFEVVTTETLVLDDEPCMLSLVLPADVPEGETRQGRLTLNPSIPRSLTVDLRSSDSTAIQVPRTLTVSPGSTNVSFALSGTEDDILTGLRVVQVTAEVPGWPSATAAVIASDNEARTLALSLPTTLAEGAGTNNSGTVTLTGRADADLRIELTSDDPTELTVPANVLIPAGQNAVSFVLTVGDDTQQDGTRSVSVESTAASLSPAVATIQIADNDPHHFRVEVTSDAKVEGFKFPVSVTAQDVNGDLIPAFTGGATLSARGSSGPLGLEPAVTGGFISSSWSGLAMIGQVAEGVVVEATLDTAHGQSEPFRVLASPIQHQLSMAVADMVWNPVSQRLLASVAETDTAYSNSIVTINPQTGAIEGVLHVPLIQRVSATDNPGEGRMALSADGRMLYLGTSGPTNIAQFDLSSRTVVRQFPVGTNNDGAPTIAYDFQVVPTNSERIVLARPDAWNSGSLGVYEAGLLLPDRGPRSSLVMLSPDGRTGYSYMGLSLGDQLFQFQLTGSGISGTEILPKPGIWYGGDVRLKDGLIYFSSGHVYDPAKRAWAGQYPLVGFVTRYDNPGRFEFSADGKWIWFISADGNYGLMIEMFARESFQLVRRLDLSGLNSPVLRLWQCGPEWLAFHNGSRIYILQTPLLLPVGERADLAMGYQAASPFATKGQPFTYGVWITNLGPATATDVVLDNRLPAGLEYTSATISPGRWQERSDGGRAVFGDLPPGAVASASITVTPRQGGWLTNDLMVTANEWDPVPENSGARPIVSARLGLGRNDTCVVPLTARALTYDPTRHRLYASVGNDGTAWANRVVVLDAQTAEILGAFDLGRSPDHLTVTDDGHYLYAGIEDNLAVRRFDLQTGQPDLYFALGLTPDNWVISAKDLKAVPGHPESVAILLLCTLAGSGTSGGGIAIYDNAVPRPSRGLNLDYVAASFIEFNEDGTQIFGANIINNALECFTVSPESTTMARRQLGLVGSSGTLSLDYANGRLYTSDGRIIDPYLTNVLAVPVQNGDQRAVCHRAADRLCYVRWPGGVLDIFDGATRTQLGSVNLTSVHDFIGDFVPMEEDRLAFTLYGGEIYFVRSSLLLPLDWDADGDGMPDVWELAHGLNPDLPDAAADADQDGISNLGESIAGTHPQDAGSYPRVSVIRADTDVLELRIPSVSGRQYQMERRSGFEGEGWTSSGGPRAGDGTELVFRLTGPTDSAEFYRIVISR